MDYQRRLNRQAKAQRAARGLGWFSIALGLAEIFFARRLARSLGMRGDAGLLRLYGVREVANGLGILGAKDPTPWVWGRVGGDALDIATLANRVHARNPKRRQLAIAFGAVAGATAADLVTAKMLGESRYQKVAMRDYSDRSGFPRPPDAMRGAALADFEAPRDMRRPPGMRPLLH
jgi:hypothetical protein